MSQANPTPFSSSNQIPRTPTTAMNVPSSRMRGPAPPSPLSRIQRHPLIQDGPDSTLPPPAITTSVSLPPPTALQHTQSSPCFIHSHLDRRGALQDRVQKRNDSPQRRGPPSQQVYPQPAPQVTSYRQNALAPLPIHNHHDPESSSAGSSRLTSPINANRNGSVAGSDSDKSGILAASARLEGDLLDEDENASSITRQLAETAQGVREMSKELGRTKVRSKVQTVLIVTKARDNRLIKLTRELALYLMQKKPLDGSGTSNGNSNSNGGGLTNGYLSGKAEFRPHRAERGMIVYVDAQLRQSKRFDAAGLQKEHPDLFQPLHRRRSSSSASLSAMSNWSSTTSMGDLRRSKEEGQLRYWTGEMCSNSPHLFDFVITVSPHQVVQA